MARGKQKNLCNGNQDNLATSEPSFPIIASSRMPNTPEKEDSDLKSYLKMMMQIFEKSVNNSLKQEREEKQKELEAFKEETQKTLKIKELEENRTKEMKKLNWKWKNKENNKRKPWKRKNKRRNQDSQM